MQTTALRPLTFGEILDRSFALYRHNFGSMFVAALVPFLPIALFWVAASLVIPPTEEGAATATMLNLFLLPYSFFATLLVWGTLARLAARAHRGEAFGWADEYRETFRRLPRLIAAMILTIAAIFLGLMLLIIPGILIAIMLFAVVPLVMIEGRGPVEAIRRSRELASGAWGRIFGILLVMMIITSLPAFAVGAATMVGMMYEAGGDGTAAFGFGLALNQVLSTLASALVAPLFSLCLITLYLDRRVRSEGLDLEMEAEQLPAPA
jgi:hypothetical protein